MRISSNGLYAGIAIALFHIEWTSAAADNYQLAYPYGTQCSNQPPNSAGNYYPIQASNPEEAASNCFATCNEETTLAVPYVFQTLDTADGWKCFCFQTCGTPVPQSSDRRTYTTSETPPPKCPYAVSLSSSITKTSVKPGAKVKLTLTIANKGDEEIDNELIVYVPEGLTYVNSFVRPRTKTTTRKPEESEDLSGLFYWDLLPTDASGAKRSELKVSIILRADKEAEKGSYTVYSYLIQDNKPECLEEASNKITVNTAKSW